MPTTLSNGVSISSLTPEELAAALARARAELPQGPVRRKRTAPEGEPECILSPHTGACCRCGTPLAALTDTCDSVPGVPIEADGDVRRYLLGRGESPAYARLRRKYAR